MSVHECDESGSAADELELDGMRLIRFDALVARLTREHPDASPAELSELVRSETDAVTGGQPIVVPLAVLDGVEEMLAPHDDGE